MNVQTEPDYTLHPEGAYHPDRFSLWFSDPRYPEITHLIPDLFAVEEKVMFCREMGKRVIGGFCTGLLFLSILLAVAFVAVVAA